MTGKKTFEVSVVVFREEDGWTALALEMSVRGHGSTSDEAMGDLTEMLQPQVSFAIHQGHPESVWQPAGAEYWEMFEEARRNRFVAEASGSEAPVDPIADVVPLSLVALKARNDWTVANGA